MMGPHRRGQVCQEEPGCASVTSCSCWAETWVSELPEALAAACGQSGSLSKWVQAAEGMGLARASRDRDSSAAAQSPAAPGVGDGAESPGHRVGGPRAEAGCLSAWWILPPPLDNSVSVLFARASLSPGKLWSILPGVPPSRWPADLHSPARAATGFLRRQKSRGAPCPGGEP